jgi:hypothetical protein
VALFLKQQYRRRLWYIYARAVSMVSVLGVTIALMIGGYDVVKIISPSSTLNSALHEKYQNNDSYTEYGTFKKSLTDPQITRERTLNYAKLLRIERRNGQQRLIKVGLGLFVLLAMNGVLVRTGKGKFSTGDSP